MNVENLVRSGVVLVLGLPLTIAATISISERPTKNYATITKSLLKAELTEPCLKWAFSKTDSKLERSAKDLIDDSLGGEVEHEDVCRWVLS